MVQVRWCESHGPFRGDTCPICGEEGKFMLNDWELVALSRMLAGILRHFPEKFGVRLDDHGWANLYDIVKGIKRRHRRFGWLKIKHIEAIVLTDDKGRYQLDLENRRIRATYGHSIKVDLSDLPTEGIPETLYYPTTEEELEFIQEMGLKPGDRKWVHLSKNYEDAYIAGRHRVDDPIVLEIDAHAAVEAGYPIYVASPKVFISNEIPPEFITVAEKREVEVPEEELKKIEEEKIRREKKLQREQERMRRYGSTED
ncbi:MAG: RNA 2'-phosphotransferase [Euryarchaeota archaeon]|nr:RNA 2'-phosphotransferase [Euryarchaeota archaeon]